MSANPDLAAERKFLAKANDRLETMRESAREMMELALASPRGGTHQARAERDVIVRHSLARLEQLEIGDQALSFGGIDYDAELGRVASFHIGRLAVADEDMEPLVVDWRAPVAEPFYRATGKDPMGLTRRRHFALENRDVASIEDELFSAEGFAEGSWDSGEPKLAGPGSLFAAVARARTGRMADIVSTIQAQQDEIIRAPLSGMLVVQGGPGTGKTAVALHRAAYLLYTYRRRLERQGVLVVAPNRIFARYIDHVLPSLGETGVQIMTVNGLAGFGEARIAETDAEARLKGDLRMATFIAKAIKDRERPLKRTAEIVMGAFVVRVTPGDSAEAVRAAQHRSGTHNQRRRFVEALLAVKIAEKYLAAKKIGSTGNADAGSQFDEQKFNILDSTSVDEKQVKKELAQKVKRLPEFQFLVQRIWPKLTPQVLLSDLFSHLPLIHLAGKEILSETETRLLHRPTRFEDDINQWSSSDLVLLNEASIILGSYRNKNEDPDGERGYGHIIMDEAQDLSPMAARMIGRYSLSGSMTLVGDVAQATSPFGRRTWHDIVAPLAKSDPVHLVELEVNYRTPQEVMDVAGGLLKEFAPELKPATSIRKSGEFVEIIIPGREDLFESLAKVVSAERDKVDPGTVAVIVPADDKHLYVERLSQAGLEFSSSGEASVSVLSIHEAKGLEFDSVVIAGANRLLSAATLNPQALFVAMTRTTKRLVIVHNNDVPDVIVDLILKQK
ncbi:MAG: hypothetical protein EPN30_05095 [Actinomycetota bacterium]|nr:MAG: hypothetical protein EPN30_05095 [Actinomycetota bacterium]